MLKHLRTILTLFFALGCTEYVEDAATDGLYMYSGFAHKWQVIPIDEGRVAASGAMIEWNGNAGFTIFSFTEGKPLHTGIASNKMTDGALAIAERGFMGDCTIYFRDTEAAKQTYVWVHELGHCLGFSHDPDPQSIMFYRPNPENKITDEMLSLLEIYWEVYSVPIL